MTNATKIIPQDVEKFYAYINSTDDCQAAIDTIGYTIYPVGADGKSDYKNEEGRKKIINEPIYKRWEWTDEQSHQWSQFRKEYAQLYKKYEGADKAAKGEFKNQLEQIISKCIAYDGHHQLLDRVAHNVHSNQAQMRTFGVKQHPREYKTSLRTIHIIYDEDLPFTPLEDMFIEKYIAMHELTFETIGRVKKLQADIKALHRQLPALWEQVPVIKDKADKAFNQIFIPPPTMKGSFSVAVGFRYPTPEESRQYADDFNNHYEKFQEEVTTIYNQGNELFDELEWAQNLLDDNEKSEYSELLDETDNLNNSLYNDFKRSIEVLAFSDEYDEFRETLSDLSKEADKAGDVWEEFVAEESLFIKLYNAFTGFLGERFGAEEEKDDELLNLTKGAADNETDDLHAETIRRYEADIQLNTNSFYDVEDWHIIIDHFGSKHDNKSKAKAMEQAMAQHLNHPTLLLRQAQEEAGAHQYQKALALIKQAEEQGPPHHPNLYYIKADIYNQLQTPEAAIPIYRKLIAQKGEELKWWRTNSYEKLVEIYEKQKNYAECITLCRELMAENRNDEYPIGNLARLYCLNNQAEEAVKPLKAFLAKHPQSAVCHKRLGLVYADMKQYDKAIEHFDMAFETDKQEQYPSIFHKGNALMELKNFEEAAICFELCLFYFKLSKDFHVKAAQCYTQLNLQPLATAHYRKALAVDPDCKEALDALLLLQKLS